MMGTTANNWIELTMEESFEVDGGGFWDGVGMACLGIVTCAVAVGVLATSAITVPVAAVAYGVYVGGQIIAGGGVAKIAGAW
jgi:hypothetical protein